MTGFHATTQKFDNMVIREFGDNVFSGSLHEKQAPEEIELQEQHQITEPVLDISEYPWANGELEAVEGRSVPA